jgi:hypothetical protein
MTRLILYEEADMGRPRRAENRPASFHDLAHAAGEGIWNAAAVFRQYCEIRDAGGFPEILFNQRDGYSVFDGLQRDILINRMRHERT